MPHSFNSISLLSPAKVNLFLRILHKRPDGYHELASLFQAIALCDTLHVTKSDTDQLVSTNPHLPTGPTNLIWKAIELYRNKTGYHFSVKVELEKRIPVEAGLGGGSSNAATALWAVNRLAESPVSIQELTSWAAEIGADVPFFFSSGTAYCTGRGEQIESLPRLPKQDLQIFKPVQGLSTPLVYRNLKLDKLIKRDPMICLKQFMEGQSIFFNDLEESAFELLPSLYHFKKSLEALDFEYPLLSGSGSAFFCLGSKTCDFKDIPGLAFRYTTQFINRSEHCWYELGTVQQ